MSVASREPGKNTGGYRWLLGGMLVAGLAIRLLLVPDGVFEGDFRTFGAWAVQLVHAPPSAFYASGRPADHLPGDLWLLWAIAQLYHTISPGMAVGQTGFLFLVKLVPSLADVGIGFLLFQIVRQMASPRVGLLAAALYLFNPAPILVSGLWGQWDAVSAFVMVGALWLILSGRPAWSLPALTYASLIKPQMALLIPLALIAWWRWAGESSTSPSPGGEGRGEGGLALGLAGPILASAVVFFAVDLPFNVGLRFLPTRWTIFDRLAVSLDTHTSVSLNADNLWQLVAPGQGFRGLSDDATFLAGLSYQTWGMLLLAAAVAFALGLFWYRPTRAQAIWSALAITFASFLLPTRIHERYLLPAVVLAVLATALIPALRWLGVVLSATYFVNVYEVFISAGRAGIGALNRFGQSDGFGSARGFGRAGGFGRGGFNQFGPGGIDPTSIIARDVSTINLAAFLAVLLIGLYLALRARSETTHSKLATNDELESGSTTRGESWHGSESYNHRSA